MSLAPSSPMFDPKRGEWSQRKMRHAIKYTISKPINYEYCCTVPAASQEVLEDREFTFSGDKSTLGLSMIAPSAFSLALRVFSTRCAGLLLILRLPDDKCSNCLRPCN